MYDPQTTALPTTRDELLNLFSWHGNRIDVHFRGARGFCRAPLHDDPRVILLCFTNRSGSTYLASEMSLLGLCGQPNSESNFEFLNAETVIGFSSQAGLRSFADYFCTVAREHRSPLGFFCCKGSIDQIAWLLRKNAREQFMTDPLVVRIVRRNVLAQSISMVIAEQTGEWTSLHPRSGRTPKFDRHRIHAHREAIIEANRHADVFFASVCDLAANFVYEEIVQNPESIAQTLEGPFGTSLEPAYPRTLAVGRQSSPVKHEWKRLFLANA